MNDPKSVDDYLARLPAERRFALLSVREVILDNLQDGFEEGIQYRMIGYFVPHTRHRFEWVTDACLQIHRMRRSRAAIAQGVPPSCLGPQQICNG